MKNPFPGMNPWLETVWKSFHVYLLTGMTRALNRELSGSLVAVAEEDVRVESVGGEGSYGYVPDVAVIETPSAGIIPSRTSTDVAVMEPITLQFIAEPIKLRYAKIVDTSDGHRVVTAIEVLSPWNKLPGKLNDSYCAKLHQYDEASVNWVEIDLLRSARDYMLVTWDALPADRRADYLILSKNEHTRNVSAYPFSLRDKLPAFVVPLRKDDLPVVLDLQSVLNEIWVEHRLAAIVNYSRELKPPLREHDRLWATHLLIASGTSV